GLGFVADGLYDLLAVRSALMADGDHRGLVQDDAFVAGKNEGVRGAEINREVGGKIPTENSEHSTILSGTARASACHRRVTGVEIVGERCRRQAPSRSPAGPRSWIGDQR